MKIAFLGERGSYSEQAVFNYFGADVNPLHCPTFDLVFDSLALGLAEAALIPIENSLAGSIHQNYDLLAQHHLFITGEMILRIRHCLIALPDVKKEEIHKVISHPQALAQCADYLKKYNIKTESAPDTASSVKKVKELGDKYVAAIASKRAAEIYAMHILEEGIEDNEKNFTRFLCLGIEPTVPKGEAKTSLVFESQSLHQVLNLFAESNLVLTKIESRPIQNKTWEYFYFVDVLGLVDEALLKKMEQSAENVKILGSYSQKRPAG